MIQCLVANMSTILINYHEAINCYPQALFCFLQVHITLTVIKRDKVVPIQYSITQREHITKCRQITLQIKYKSKFAETNFY